MLSPSCSDENEALSGSGNEALVSFSVNLADGIQTKAISDGKTAKQLFVRVFEDNNGSVGDEINTLAKNDVQMEDDLTKEVNFALVKGKTYHFLFWSQAYTSGETGAPYSFDGHTVKVSYVNAAANEEKRDAFYAVKTKTVTGSFQEDVTLHRPFAQLNFLTTAKDIIAAKNGGLSVNQTSITIASAAQTLTPPLSFNPDEKPSVSNAEEGVSFNFADVPFSVSGETVSSSSSLWIKDNAVVDPGTQDAIQYFYLAITYFLVNNAADATAQIVLADVNMKVKDAEGDGLSVQSVPLRMNYRTNIYGNLLTATGKFNVMIDENFNTPQPPEQNIEIKEREVDSEAAAAVAFADGAAKVTLTEELPSAESSEGIIPQTYAQENTEVIELVLEKPIMSGYVFKYNTTGQGESNNHGPATVHITIPESLGGSEAITESNIQLPQSTVYVNGVKVTTMTAETASNTLVVGPGTVIGTLNVKQGNVRIEKGGKVGTITRETDNGDATTIVFLAGGELTNTPTDGKIIVQSTITSAEELFAFAEAVNAGDTYAGRTVYLGADIDLNNATWTPIGLNADDAKKFKGTFDGQNFTIKNFKVAIGDVYQAAGFFGALNGTAKNFTIDGATISSQSTGNASNITDNGVAVVAGSIYPSGSIENVTVRNSSAKSLHYVAGIAGYVEKGAIKNCTVESSEFVCTPHLKTNSETDYDNGDKAGGIVGHMDANSNVENCSVSNVTIKGYRELGGIVGYAGNKDNVTVCSVSNVTLIQDNTNGYAEAVPTTLGALVGGYGDKPYSYYDGEDALAVTKIHVVGTASVLKSVLEAAGSGTGDRTISITANLDFSEVNWTPVMVDGQVGAGVVTVEGNNHMIKKLKDALFAGGFAGRSGIIINDLTIDGTEVTINNSTDTLGWGYFIKTIDSMPTITLENCHLKNANVTSTGSARVGGLIGWTAGYNKENDGPVKTYVTIEDCSVKDSKITANGSVGAINGHAGNNAWTFTTITNCTVTNCTLNSKDDGSWRVGVVVGTANVGEVTISNITAIDNELTQDGKTAPKHSNLYGRFVPQNGSGKLTIDGVAITQ